MAQFEVECQGCGEVFKAPTPDLKWCLACHFAINDYTPEDAILEAEESQGSTIDTLDLKGTS